MKNATGTPASRKRRNSMGCIELDAVRPAWFIWRSTTMVRCWSTYASLWCVGIARTAVQGSAGVMRLRPTPGEPEVGRSTRVRRRTRGARSGLHTQDPPEPAVELERLEVANEDDDLLVEDVYTRDPFASPETHVFQPRLNNVRIIAQHGWFTLHRYSTKDKRFVALEKNLKTNANLTQMRVPAASRNDILRSLERHGISSRTLFPDLEGLCQHLNWKHVLA